MLDDKTSLPRFLTAAEVGQMLSLSQSAVYTLAAPVGPLPCHRFGRAVRFAPADVEAFIALSRTAARPIAGRASPPPPVIAPWSEEFDMLKEFRKMGIEPKLTPTIGRNRGSSRKANT